MKSCFIPSFSSALFVSVFLFGCQGQHEDEEEPATEVAQPTGSSVLNIAEELKKQLKELRQTLPPDMQLAFYYDQSLLVRDSLGSV